MTEEGSKLSQPLSERYGEVGYRFVNLVVYLLAALVNSLPTSTFSSINTLVEDKFQYHAVVITLNTLMFPVLHPICAVPANWILDKWGMDWGCRIGSVFVIGGVWLRTAMDVGQPTWCLVGSALAAIGGVFILNSPSILANNWFKPKSIPSIIAGTVLANLVSMTAGASAPGLILTKESSASEIIDFLRLQAIIITVPLIFMIILIREQPPKPPSKSAQERKNKQNTEKYKEGLKKLFSNKEYLKIMLAMTLEYGANISYLANLDQSLGALGYHDPGQTTAEAILSAMLFGIFSTLFLTYLIKHTLQYKKLIIICLAAGSVCFFALNGIFVGEEDAAWIVIFGGGIIGIFLIPMPSLFMAYSSEVSFPEGEGSSTGYLFAASQTFGFVLGLATVSFIDKDTKWKIYLSMGFHTFFILMSTFAIVSTKQILSRHNYQMRKKNKTHTEEDSIIVYQNTHE